MAPTPAKPVDDARISATREDAPLLRVRNLKTHFLLDAGTVRAVDGVDLELHRGKTLCIVGESGCGKSMTGYSIMRLINKPGRIVEGEILFDPEDAGEPIDLATLHADGEAIRRVHGNQIGMIFQEPMTALSPVHTVGSQIVEAVRLHMRLGKAAARRHAIHMMQRVGMPDAPRRFKQHPHEMSGGLRQRAVIAMALCCEPALLIADEPTTALDVTIQAQILRLMRELQRELNMSIMFITHDLGVVAEIADEVAVMYMGRVVERAETNELFENPQHPYTRALLKSIPGASVQRKTELQVIRGSVPDPYQQLAGCPFHPRCDEAVPGKCDVGARPALIETIPDHGNACLLRHEESKVE
ncbi:MAG: ABC transporter ATP-binding protein [Phycisphaeraceae bacterium]